MDRAFGRGMGNTTRRPLAGMTYDQIAAEYMMRNQNAATYADHGSPLVRNAFPLSFEAASVAPKLNPAYEDQERNDDLDKYVMVVEEMFGVLKSHIETNYSEFPLSAGHGRLHEITNVLGHAIDILSAANCGELA